ncbi:MAG: HEAT repeat domain-containing protein [Planctomycetaceae bacterium]
MLIRFAARGFNVRIISLAAAGSIILLWGGCSGEQATTAEPTSSETTTQRESARVDETTPELQSALGNESVVTADAAPMSATEKQAREALRTLTTDGVSGDAWEQAHQTLVDLGADAVDVLKDALRSDDALTRDSAASVLALSPEAARQARTELAACLDHSSNYLRANAAAALALIPGEEDRVVPVLLELSQSSDAELKRMAAVNLRNLAPALRDRVTELRPLLRDADSEVLLPVLEVLNDLGEFSKPLQSELERLATQSEDPAVQTAARQALDRLPTETGPELSCPRQ